MLHLPTILGVSGNPTFEIFSDRPGTLPSVSRLDPRLTINGASVLPTFRYKGGDANTTNWAPWGYGEALTYNAGGGAVTPNAGSPLLGDNDDSVKFDGNAYYAAGNNTLGNVGTNDFIVELVFEATGSTCILAAKRNGGVGWEVGIDASDRLYATLNDGSSSTVVSAALTDNTWYHAAIICDRSGGAQIYINGLASGSAVNISSEASTLDSATALTIGDDSGGDNNEFDSRLAYIALWKEASWL